MTLGGVVSGMLEHIANAVVGAALVLTACVHASSPPSAGAPSATARLSNEEQQAVVSAVTQLFRAPTVPVPVCMQIMDSTAAYELPAKVLRALRPRSRGTRDCPPTYTTMIYIPARVRPAGYVDPYHLNLRRPRASALGHSIDAQLWQGTGVTDYRCDARPRDPRWTTVCVVTGMGVS
jgi:hypothetical protein